MSFRTAPLWGGICIGGLAVAIAFASLGLSVTAPPASRLVALAVAMIAWSARLRLRPSNWTRIAVTLESWALFAAISLIGGLASYAVAASSTAYCDATLAAADRMIGFDWRVAYWYVVHHPEIGGFGKLAYLGIFYSPFFTLTTLIWTKRTERARQFLVAHAIALGLTILLFHFFPSRSAITFFLGSDVPYIPLTGLRQADVIDALRSGAMTTIDLDDLGGLINFPSFHAISALLVIWAIAPVRSLRVLMIFANLAMIAATPVEGAHYLIDLIGGALVAVVAVAVARTSLKLPVGSGADLLASPLPAFAMSRRLLYRRS